MTTNRSTGFAVVFAVLLTVSMGVLGVHGSALAQTHENEMGEIAVQDSTTGLNLTASGSNVIVPDHNVTANFTLTNTGEEASTASTIELLTVPDEWEVVNQSSPAGVNWSEAQRAWVSTESLAPGESVSVSVTFRLANDKRPTQYYVSAIASNTAGQSNVATETFPVSRTTDENLTAEASVADSATPGENVTVDLTLRNTGEADSVASTVGIVLPSGWSVVNQSSEANLNYSEANVEWISTQALAPGESITVTAVLQSANETLPGEYWLSVRGYDANGHATTTVTTITVLETTENETTTES